MTTKKKQLKKRLRQKRLKKENNLRKAVMKRAMDKVGKKMTPQPEKDDILTNLYKMWRDFMVYIGEIKCTYGIHDWKLCSGRPGQPKYTCCRCWIRSKILWEGIGSKEHYEKKEEKAKVIYETKPNYNFEEVDIFLRVKGRLPTEDGDNLTQDILDEYCDKFKKGELTEGAVSLRYMYDLIKNKKISIKK